MHLINFMKKFWWILFIAAIIALAVAIRVNAATNTLYGYYQGHLPSVQNRQDVAAQAGIANYTGTADQNNQLLSYLLNSQDNQSYGGASVFQVYQGGTGQNSIGKGDVLVGNGAGGYDQKSSSSFPFISVETDPIYWAASSSKLGTALPAGQIFAGNASNIAAATSTIFLQGGNVGIGTTSPSQLLSVGKSNNFTVDSSGNIVAPTWNGLSSSAFSRNLNLVASSTDTWDTGKLIIGVNAETIKSQFGITSIQTELGGIYGMSYFAGVEGVAGSGSGYGVVGLAGSNGIAGVLASSTGSSAYGLIAKSGGTAAIYASSSKSALAISAQGAISATGGLNISTGQTYKINNVALAKGDVGLGNVDNTSDATKNSASVTLTNKWITPRVWQQNDQRSLAINFSLYDVVEDYGIGGTVTISSTVSPPQNGQIVTIMLMDAGVSKTINWSTGAYEFNPNSATALPTATVAGKLMILQFQYYGNSYGSQQYWMMLTNYVHA